MIFGTRRYARGTNRMTETLFGTLCNSPSNYADVFVISATHNYRSATARETLTITRDWTDGDGAIISVSADTRFDGTTAADCGC